MDSDNWQREHDRLMTHIADLVRERERLLAELDAAEAMIASLRAQLVTRG